MYGIPSMKLDKIEKVMRRIKLLQQDAWTLADACGRWRTLAYAALARSDRGGRSDTLKKGTTHKVMFA